MASFDFDFAVIGGGSAGYAAARTAVDCGLRTVVIDGAETLGGLCILRGCMPSKALIESANRARAIRRSAEFGLHTGPLEVRPAEIAARRRWLIDDFAGYRQNQLADGRFELIRARAEFQDSHTVVAGDRRVTFATACIATGSTIRHLELPGLEQSGFWTSDDALVAEEVPRSIVVLGGGAIALEMACYYEGMGSEVTVIQRSGQLLSGTDRDVADELEKALISRPNLRVFTGTKLERMERSGAGEVTVHFAHRGAAASARGERLLVALGRRPAVEGLNLAAAGVDWDKESGRIAVNEWMECSQPHLFAAGDVCSQVEVVHIAIQQGEIAARRAAELLGRQVPGQKPMDYQLKLFGVFTDPQVAMVGLTEKEAQESGLAVVAATYPFGDHGKSMILGETHGFVKLIADAETKELLGGAVVGPEACELIHEIAVALKFRCSAAEFLEIPHYHPTLSEIWTYPAEEILTL